MISIFIIFTIISILLSFMPFIWTTCDDRYYKSAIPNFLFQCKKSNKILYNGDPITLKDKEGKCVNTKLKQIVGEKCPTIQLGDPQMNNVSLKQFQNVTPNPNENDYELYYKFDNEYIKQNKLRGITDGSKIYFKDISSKDNKYLNHPFTVTFLT